MAPCGLAGICRLLLLSLSLTVVFRVEAIAGKNATLRRQKREWIIPPTKLMENVDHTHKEYIAKIRSDLDSKNRVKYSLSGIGADQPPVNLFIVNQDTGYVTVTGILDREEYKQFDLTAYARLPDGSLAENKIDLKITVLDQNDNPPVFQPLSASVRECRQVGTYVATMTAMDADEEGTLNSQIAYSILSQEPAGSEHVFAIDKMTGAITVKKPILDREVIDLYTVVIQGVDGFGAPGGNTGTGTVRIEVRDINDNVPTLEKDLYSGNVDEGTEDVVVVMRIKALDVDLENSDNWLAVFHLVSGNEEGLFTIETDPLTNEGILKLIKPVDYEKIKEIDLDMLVENVAPFVNGTAVALGLEIDLPGPGINPSGGGGGVPIGPGGAGGPGIVPIGPDGPAKPGTKPGISPGVKPGTKPGTKPSPGPGKKPGKSYPIKIAVNNKPDGPGFHPEVKEISVAEDPEVVKVPMVIATYPATDGDTGEVAENVRYAKGHDPDNWFTIDETTAEIKLNKVPDRESPFVVNGTYKALILCMTDEMPSKTVTGTIVLTVEDSNDHCPMLTSTYQSACTDAKVVNISAFDADDNANPLSFRLIEKETKGAWEMKSVDDTTAAFWAKEPLWPGMYRITVEVSDAQGSTCPDRQTMEVVVCTCDEGGGCGFKAAANKQTSSSVNVGMTTIGLMILGLALILLVPLLLLFCQCGAAAAHFTEMPFDAKEYLIPYHIESNGEDKEVPLFSSPVTLANAGQPVSAVNVANVATKSSTGLLGKSSGSFYGEAGGTFHQEMMGGMQETDYHGFHQNSFGSGRRQELYTSHTHMERDIFEGITLPDDLLHGYYSQKAMHETQNCKLNDCLLVYNYEGQGSPAGSVGCCSLLGSDDDLAFLDNLGPKFTTLAQICKPPKPIAVSKAASLQTDVKRESSISTTTTKVAQSPPPLPPIQPTVTDTTRTISSSATLPRMHLSQTVPTQTVLVQQQQPLYYLVEPQVQHRVVLAKRSPVGLGQGVLLVNSGPVIQGVIPSQTTTPTSPTLLLQGGQTLVQHSTLPRVTTAGSHRVVLVQRQPGDVAVTQGQTFTHAPQQIYTPAQERVVLLDRQVGKKPDAPESIRTLWPTGQFKSPAIPTYESGQLSSERVNMVQSNITHVSRPQSQQSLFSTRFTEGVSSPGLAPAGLPMSSFPSMGVEETFSVSTIPQVPPIATGTVKELFEGPSVPAVDDLVTDTTQQEEVSEEIQGIDLAEEHVAVVVESDKAEFQLEIDSTEKVTVMSEDVSNELGGPEVEATVDHEESLPVSSQALDVTASPEMSETEKDTTHHTVPEVTAGNLIETILEETDAGWAVDEYASDTVLLSKISPGDTDIIDLVADQISASHLLQSESGMVKDTINSSRSAKEVSATQGTHAEEIEDEVSSMTLEDNIEAEESGPGDGKASYVDGHYEFTPSTNITISHQETTAVSETEIELDTDKSPGPEASLDMFQGTEPAEIEAMEITHLQMQQVTRSQVLVKTALEETKDVATEGDGVILTQVVSSEMDGVTAEKSLESNAASLEEEREVEEIIEYIGLMPESETSRHDEEEHQDLLIEEGSKVEDVEAEKSMQEEKDLSSQEQLLREEELGSTLDVEISNIPLSEGEQDLKGESLDASEDRTEKNEDTQELIDEESLEPNVVEMQTVDPAFVEEEREVEEVKKYTGQMPEAETSSQDVEEHQDLQIEEDSNVDFPEAEKPMQEMDPSSHEQLLREEVVGSTLDVEMPNVTLRVAEQDLQGGSLDASEDQSERNEEEQEPIDDGDMSDAGSMSVQCSTAYSEQTDDLSESECVEEDGYDEAVLDANVTPVKSEGVQPCDDEDMMLVSVDAAPIESEMSMPTVEIQAESVVEESPEHPVPDVAGVEEAGASLVAEGELVEATFGLDKVTEAGIDLEVATAEQPDHQTGTEGEEVQTESEGVAAETHESEVSTESDNGDADVEREQAERIVTTAVSDEAEEPVGLEIAAEKPETEAALETEQANPESVSVEAEQQRAEPQPRKIEMEIEESEKTLEILQTLEVTEDLDLQTETGEVSSAYLSAEVGEVLHSVASSEEMEADSPIAEKPEEEEGQGPLPQGQELGATAEVSSSSVGKKQKKASKKALKGPKSPKSPMGKCKQQ
ncbi:uncharacterized protein LOC143117500 [Alosa pseudoharengus]|uniref:uncharacterized protein LOC143117500 n=1 Tax=Alosa pseudoharengus TaxID=34774 RepID=UPI003F8C2ACF